VTHPLIHLLIVTTLLIAAASAVVATLATGAHYAARALAWGARALGRRLVRARG
jgi:hypothetical protein